MASTGARKNPALPPAAKMLIADALPPASARADLPAAGWNIATPRPEASSSRRELVYPSRGLLIVSTSGGSWVVPPQRAVWLPAAVAHAHQAYGATQLRTVAFRVHVNPLGLTQPTVLSVSRLLRELIIALTDDPARPLDEQRDLKRVALHQLRPAPVPRAAVPPAAAG